MKKLNAGYSTDLAEKQKRHFRYLVYIIIIYYIFFLGLNFIRLWGFGFAISDFGMFRQLIWNTLHGRLFEYTAAYPYKEGVSYLGYYHFSIVPVLAALPFYAVLPFPETLCVLHIFLICLPAFIIYNICLKLKTDQNQAVFWSLLYLFNPITLHHALFSYAEMSFAPLLISLALYYIISRKLTSLIITAIFLAMVKEHYSISLIGFGIIWAWSHKSYKTGLILGLIGLAISASIFFVIMPILSNHTEHVMISNSALQNNAPMFKRYQWLTGSTADILSELPQKLATAANIKFLYAMFVPFLLLPLGRGRIFILAAISDFAAILLSDFVFQKSINLNYSPGIIPVLIVASCYSLNNGLLSKPKYQKPVKLLLLITTAAFALNVMWSPIARLNLINNEYMDWTTGKDFQDAIKYIPNDASVMADDVTATMLSDRRFITGLVPEALKSVDYVIIRLNPQRYYFINQLIVLDNINNAKAFLNSPNWGLIYWRYPYAIFKKQAPNNQVEKDDLRSYLQKLGADDKSRPNS